MNKENAMRELMNTDLDAVAGGVHDFTVSSLTATVPTTTPSVHDLSLSND